MKEKIAVIIVLITVAAVPLLIFGYRFLDRTVKYPPDTRVFQLTAVAGNGAYTLEEVNGLSYWWKRYAPMTLMLEVGDHVVFEIKSADVTHQFYVPGLEIEPVEIRPEKNVVVEFTAREPGIFQYFCMTMCGQCHVYMTGWIVISPVGEKLESPTPIVCPLCFVDFGRPPEGKTTELGEYLYLYWTCNACHGWDGQGGVKNPNYAKKTIPAHENTAEKLFLKTAEDSRAFMELLAKHPDLKDLEDDPDIPLFNVISARYRALKNIIRNGSSPQRLNPDGPEPPLWMPAWQFKLTDHEIDSLIHYFIDLYPWDEEEDDEEDEA